MQVWYTFAAQRGNDLQSHRKERKKTICLSLSFYWAVGNEQAEFTENKELKTRTTVAHVLILLS